MLKGLRMTFNAIMAQRQTPPDNNWVLLQRRKEAFNVDSTLHLAPIRGFVCVLKGEFTQIMNTCVSICVSIASVLFSHVQCFYFSCSLNYSYSHISQYLYFIDALKRFSSAGFKREETTVMFLLHRFPSLPLLDKTITINLSCKQGPKGFSHKNKTQIKIT